MGKKTVHFKCHHCGHCCRDVVCLPTPQDVIRIVKATGVAPEKFLEFLTPDQISEVPKSDPTWLRCGKKRYIMALRRKKKGCFFVDRQTRLCTVYDARPILCRLYPFKLHEKRDGSFKSFTLHPDGDVECPRYRDGEVPTKPLYDYYLEDCGHQENYDDLVAVFNRKKDKNRRPQDFIGMFVKPV